MNYVANPRGRRTRGTAPRIFSQLLCIFLFFGNAFALESTAGAQVNLKPASKSANQKSKEPLPDPMVELEKVKAELQEQLREQETAGKAREEAIRKEQASALDILRAESAKRLEMERDKRQQEIANLRLSLQEAERRVELREQLAIPKVEVVSSQVTLYGLIQADLQFKQSSEDQLASTTGQFLNEDRFLVRRARVGVVINKKYGEGRIEVDGNTVRGAAFRLINAEASLKWPGGVENLPPLVMGTIGLFRIPFGYETSQNDRKRLFLERSTVSRALFPGEFDIGMKISGAWQFLRYELAVQNGQPVGSASFSLVDPNHQKDILGRVGVEETIRGKVDVAAGVSAMKGSGFHAGALATKPIIQYTDSNEDNLLGTNEIKGIPGQAAGQSSSFTRYGFGADLSLISRALSIGASRIHAEFYLGNDLDRGIYPADPKGALGRSMREIGYVLSISQRVRQFEIGVRYDYYNPDRDSNQLSQEVSVPTNPSYSTLAIAWAMVAPWGRFIVEYDLNRNHLGFDTAGRPSNLKDNTLALRGEIGF